MKRLDVKQLLAYLAVSSASVGGAFLISLQFMGESYAQDEALPPAVDEVEEFTPPPAPPSMEELPEPVATETPAPQETEQKSGGLAELEGFLEPFLYDVVNRRDPFLAYAEFIPTEDNANSRPLSRAQRYAIEDMRLVGVMWDVRDPKAMFIDPDKEVHMLGRDQSIGNRNGYIAAIREGEVVVVEAVRKRGDIIYRTKVLRIER